MGDQRQLEQPIQGSHPGESGQSCLNYLIQDHITIPPELGLFLERTYRMRPEVCSFVSDRFYESRLMSDPSTTDNSIALPKGAALVTKPSGILFVPVEHSDCQQSSQEEVQVILNIVDELLKAEFKFGKKSGTITLKDILVVTPYNMQVKLLKQSLPNEIEVGTVDKLQGREAAVVILSMASSSLEATPRGVEFLFNPNRLNVAISRAKCLAIVVGNPELAATDETTVEKMRMVNLFCALVQCT